MAGTPITDSEKVKVQTGVGTFWMVAYLPRAIVSREHAAGVLQEITSHLKGVTWKAESA